MKFVHLFLVASALSIQPALAQDGTASPGEGSQLVGLIDSVVNFITKLIEWVLPIASGLIVIMILIGGFQTITGQKDLGKKTITAALAGAVIIALSYFMVSFVKTFF